ncbi:hypothetical protein, partial [Klebsiella oxytoca]|uniref:hypothetical protein n=2 Tax=Klebsiella oxytoca TaxID=571 RepID=UPI001CCFFC82
LCGTIILLLLFGKGYQRIAWRIYFFVFARVINLFWPPIMIAISLFKREGLTTPKRDVALCRECLSDGRRRRAPTAKKKTGHIP